MIGCGRSVNTNYKVRCGRLRDADWCRPSTFPTLARSRAQPNVLNGLTDRLGTNEARTVHPSPNPGRLMVVADQREDGAENEKLMRHVPVAQWTRAAAF